jgi:hypothetical protein
VSDDPRVLSIAKTLAPSLWDGSPAFLGREDWLLEDRERWLKVSRRIIDQVREPLVTHESVYVYAMQRILCLATAHKSDEDAARLRTAMAEIAQFIHHALAELDRLTLENRR